MITQSSEARIRELIAVGSDAVNRGLVLASGGNISARLDDDRFAVTASGTWLDQLNPESFTIMTLGGEVVGGDPNPSSEWKLHQRSYIARPDARAMIHLHPQHAVLLGTLGVEIRLMTLDHVSYVRSIGMTPFYPNGSDELADSAAEQLREHNCVVMQHHGCSVVADSISMAYRRTLNLEEAAKSTLIALQLGDTTTAFPAEFLDKMHG